MVEQKKLEDYKAIDVSQEELDLKDKIIKLQDEKIKYLEAKIEWLEEGHGEGQQPNSNPTPQTKPRLRTASQLSHFLEERSKRLANQAKAAGEPNEAS